MNKFVKNGGVTKKLGQALAPIHTGKKNHDGSASPLALKLQEACPIHNSFENIPGPKPSLPFIGTNWQYFGKYSVDKLHEAYFMKFHKYGHISKEEFKRGIPFLHLYNPDDFITVFRSQGRTPIRPSHEATYHYRRSNPDKYKSVGLTNAQGEEWRNLRKAVSPVMLDLNITKGYLPKQNEVCEDFIALLDSVKDPNTSTISDFQHYLYRLALESISLLSLDARIGCLQAPISQDSEASKMINSTQGLFLAFQLLYYGFPFWKYFETPAYKLLANSEAYMFDTCGKYLKNAMNELENNKLVKSSEPSTVLKSLVALEDIDPKDVKMTLIDSMIAGIDTVSNSLTFMFYELARHPCVQQKLWKEIDDVLPNKRNLAAEDLGKLPYLNATIKEVFRLSPTIPGIVRCTTKEHILAGHRVPENTTVFCHNMVASRLEENFADPNSFTPERWLGLNSQKEQNKKYSVLTFGYGARMCIGRRFAEQEIKATLVKVLQNFRLEMANKEEPPIGQIYRFLVIPERKLNLRLVRRN